MHEPDQLLTPELESLNDLLDRLVVEQKEELQNKEFQDIPYHWVEDLFTWFKTTNRFKQTYEEAVSYQESSKTHDELYNLRRRFTGKLFQDLTYIFLAANEFTTRIVLSPERTLEFYKGLYPDASEVKNPFKLDSLRGISVPDGLIIDEHSDVNEINNILAICEYTLSKHSYSISKKYHGFEIDNEKFPQFFNNAYFHLVIPKDGVFTHRFKNTENPLFKTGEMPFTHKQFRTFIKSLYEDFQQNKSYQPNT